MFTWICPQCGREVPPAYTECPDCAAAAAPPQPPEGAPEQPAAPAAAPVPPVYAAAQPAAPAPPVATVPQPAPPVSVAPPAQHHMSAWFLTIVFFLAFVGLGASIYWGYNYSRGSQGAAPAPVTEPPATRTGGKPHPLQKYIEIAGVRFTGDKNQTYAKFLLINHSEAEIANLAANVTVWGRTQRSEEDAVGTISFRIPDIGANESKEVTAPLTTKLKIYELPDWQNITAEVQITAPPAP
jgi:hypothetical protein